jgi:hypothetical protein
MRNLKAIDADIPKTRYRRLGVFSRQSRAPLIDRARLTVTMFFPLSPRLAYLIGAAYGDGSVSSRKLTYFNSDSDWLYSISNELHELTTSGTPRARSRPPSGRSVPGIEYANAALARLTNGSANVRLRIIDLLTRTRATLAAFIAGFFDAEGSASIYVNESHPSGTPEISIANTNRAILNMLRIRLGRIGIDGDLGLSSKPRKSVIEGHEVRGKKALYRLRFTSWSSAAGFARFILPWVKSKRKRIRLARILESRP